MATLFPPNQRSNFKTTAGYLGWFANQLEYFKYATISYTEIEKYKINVDDIAERFEATIRTRGRLGVSFVASDTPHKTDVAFGKREEVLKAVKDSKKKLRK